MTFSHSSSNITHNTNSNLNSITQATTLLSDITNSIDLFK